MSAIFVTGAGTDIGKTYVSCALLRTLRARGVKCDALKPVLSGFDEDAPEGSDPALLLKALGRDASAESIARIAPLRFRAPLAPPLAARAEGLQIEFAAIADYCRLRALAADGLMLIEGAGGVMSPLTETRTFLDLIGALEAPVLFVAGSYLGAVSHALSGLDALTHRGAAVLGVVVSESEPSVGLQDTRDMIQAQRPGLPVLAAVRGPPDPPPEWAEAAARLVEPHL